MPKVSLYQIANETAILLGEPSSLGCQPEESPFPGIEDRVRILAPALLANLLKETPPENLPEGKSIEGKPSVDSEGIATLSLPEDFLCLVSLKMSNWERPATEMILPDRKDGVYLFSAWGGIRGSESRPKVYLSRDSSGKRCLKMPGCTPDSTLQHALYIPYPSIDSDDMLDVPDFLREALLIKITETIAPI